MKKISIIVIIILIVGGAIFAYTRSSIKTEPVQIQSNGKTYSLQDIATHNNATDCWLAIEGRVYDVTKYVTADLHPGGTEKVVSSCGTDATVAFNTKGGNGEPHPQKAVDEMVKYYIGDLK